MAKRPLSADEIRLLEERGCTAEDWRRVRVASGFAVGAAFRDVFFSGDIELGTYAGIVRTVEGLVHRAGISHCSLRDVSIGNDCLIRDADIASADIGDGAIVDRVVSLTCSGDTSFANGETAHVLAEDGARSIVLWRSLSAQLAHLLCHLKNHPAAVALERIVRRECDALRSARSIISSRCLVRRCGILRDIRMGEGAVADGALSLENCYLEGGAEGTPARIGEDVSARHCVFLRASETGGGVRLTNCLVGEGTLLQNGFSGMHSVFFANSVFSLGEADAAMTGPYSVSTHKATLVLTCHCTFNTFGSGANSSNHHFKLGPRHGGVLRRGVKVGSNSYIFWPADIGAFSTVVGSHPDNLDTADFPFSLLLEDNGRTVVVPGVNLFSCGLFRDELKWRDRDRRDPGAFPLDIINPAALSPYTLQAMAVGAELLRRSADMGVDLRHGGAVIPANRFEPTLRLYNAALVYHTGERLLSRTVAKAGGGAALLADVVALLGEEPAAGEGDSSAGVWRDWGGMLLSGASAETIMAGLASGGLADAGAVRQRLEEAHAAYDDHEWLWLARRWRLANGEPTPEKAAGFVERWRKSVLFRHECFIKDANKEYTPDCRFGFGLEDDASEGFRRVRGTLLEDRIVALAEADRERLLNMASVIPCPGDV